MADEPFQSVVGGKPLRRFWKTASGFWDGSSGAAAWALFRLLTICVVLQLLVQYRLNLWNRDFFNALELRRGREIWHQAGLLAVIAAASIGLAVLAVWGRMTFQRRWRAWLTRRLADAWLTSDRVRRLEAAAAEHQNAEYRISEDARLATDAPIDLVVGLLAALLSAGTFVVVLWTVGGALHIDVGGSTFIVPGYLVVAAAIYATATTGAVALVGRRMAHVIERKNQAEADLRYAVGHVREIAADRAIALDTGAAARSVRAALDTVIDRWRWLAGQHMRTTLVSHGNSLLAPLVGLILCVPNYVNGTLLLGEVTQAAGAFVAVQGAFNWLVDNYPRLAEWVSSASRVGILLDAFDDLDTLEPDGRPRGRILQNNTTS